MIARHFSRVLGLAALAVPAAVPAQVDFEVEFDASASVLTADERELLTLHVQEAGRRWLQVIDHVEKATISIRLFVNDQPTASAASAVAGPAGLVVDGRTLYYEGAAYELLTGEDPNSFLEHDADFAVGLASATTSGSTPIRSIAWRRCLSTRSTR